MLDGIVGNAGSVAVPFVVTSLSIWAAACAAHYMLRGRANWPRVGLHYAFWLYLVGVVVMIVLPLPDIVPGFCTVHEDANEPELQPFSFVGDIARHSGFTRQRFSLERMVNSSPFRFAVLNVLAFVPLGIYLAAVGRGRFWPLVLIAFCVTLALEVTQGTGLYGLYPCPYRHFNVDDLMLNTLGAAAGIVLFAAWNGRAARRARSTA